MTIEWRGPVSAAAVLTTIMQFLSGSLVCKKFITKGTTGDASGFSFVCGLLSCSLWLRYGWLKGDNTVVLVNTIGCTLQLIYTLIYYRYVMKKSVFIYQVISILSFIITVYSYTFYETDRRMLLSRIGFLCCFVTMLFIAAPLSMFCHVVRVRSTETLPFPIIVMSFLVSILWYIYGRLIDDPFMEIPNAVGAILATLQLSLFLIYPSSPPTTSYSKLSQMI